ncbi:uncharacterized protein BO72DRAFT_503328 [Aspergillus fijiensis CBS 313.89]|uniref:Uncharacterized protein n=1 Tax=Aspergillus fijiensis CBS 313.89 TaxID=1448319 RepID=A0A8G1REW1_9EURO|nr:uncharacterized protein BO72DRAFT_503328 [Aspergillus fijiensis CBS 313.89]RAK71473.1 hypothetical protein BO72DRAFT_503328 [Aspergillus fijiensis CBS 313.89]
MTVACPAFRHSMGEVATSEEARQVSWEAPVPVNRFWDSFRYCVARIFLGDFTDPELRQLPIVPDSSQDQTTKVRLLLTLLQAKLATAQAASSPSQPLYETDYKRWYGLWQAVCVMQDELHLPEAEDTVRLLVNPRPDNSNVVSPHMQAEHLVKIGKYEEAEKVEGPVLAWMTFH